MGHCAFFRTRISAIQEIVRSLQQYTYCSGESSPGCPPTLPINITHERVNIVSNWDIGGDNRQHCRDNTSTDGCHHQPVFHNFSLSPPKAATSAKVTAMRERLNVGGQRSKTSQTIRPFAFPVSLAHHEHTPNPIPCSPRPREAFQEAAQRARCSCCCSTVERTKISTVERACSIRPPAIFHSRRNLPPSPSGIWPDAILPGRTDARPGRQA
jgi:hypothetical protein